MLYHPFILDKNTTHKNICLSEENGMIALKNDGTKLPVVSISSRIGVYVDHSAGTLSFYSVSDTMSLIHRVHTTFTTRNIMKFSRGQQRIIMIVLLDTPPLSSVKLFATSCSVWALTLLGSFSLYCQDCLFLCSKMAESSVPLAQNQFSCAICLDLLKDPVAIPCGHSYCMSCISDCWDQEDQKRVYSCPQCRQTFTPRPVLGKNTMLAEVVEKLKKTKLQAARPAQCSSGSGDVECDVCTGDKNRAVKSCLTCLNSYCPNHLEQHESFFRGKRHKLMDATGQLQEMICPQHEKLLEIFCRTDQCCICYLCTMDEHKNHETVSAAAERTEKQKQLEETKRKICQKLEEKQQDLEELRSAVESHKCFAQAAMEETEKVFTELIRSIEKSFSELTQLIRDQEKAEVTQAEGRLERLEQEIEDLRRRDAELEQLSHTDHHIHFLQSFQSLSVPPGSTDSPRITVSDHLYFDEVCRYVCDLEHPLVHFCRKKIEMIPGKLARFEMFSIPEPKTRQEYLKCYQQLTLDMDTISKRLVLSGVNEMITRYGIQQPYPDHPDRFEGFEQVLCRESVCGRCYWEVAWRRWVEISVSYKSISRKGDGDECGFGRNDQSWSLYCSADSCSFWHNNKEIKLPVESIFPKIGVYVDHSEGILSFYGVSDTMSLIHRVHTTFTQPLYPGFWLDGYVKLL